MNDLNNNFTLYNNTKDSQCHCPHCGERFYQEKYSKTTCAYYPPIYKNGVNINPDRNKSTIYCLCLNCGKEFSYIR